MQADLIPLCIDLDGTLVRSDMLHESTLELFKTAPLSLVRLPGWLAEGKGALKYRIAERVEIDVAHLPYRQPVLDLIERARREGRRVVLATAAAPQIAQAIAAHLGLFDEVISSDASTNLAGKAKAQALVERFGERGFDYVGDSRADLRVWPHARQAIVVSNKEGLLVRASAGACDVERVTDDAGGAKMWVKAFRVHQWLKNLLVFLPLLAAHRIAEPMLLLNAVIAFVAFSITASAVYLVNDLLDLPSDRRHHRKHRRPFASGQLSIPSGIIVATLNVLIAAGLTLFLPSNFAVILTLYLVTTSLYSFWLKKQVIVDVILLASLYTLRIIAGAAATTIVPSFWLLAFSMFVFLSLAIVKRYSELSLVKDETQLAGRGYLKSDLPVLSALGVGSGLMSVMVLALYIDSVTAETAYREPVWLWLATPIMLYWVARLWMKTHRGEIHDDPVLFAATDRQSLVIAPLLGVIFIAASLGWRFW